MTRWQALFDDLEARVGALAAADRDSEVAELTRLETSRLRLGDRFRAAVGSTLRVRCAGGLTVDGRLSRVGEQWLLLVGEDERETILARAAVASVTGMGRVAAAPSGPSAVESHLGMAHLLRVVARDRSTVRAHLTDASVWDGTFDRVAADFADLAVHSGGESRRRAEVREVLTIPLAAIVAVRR